MAHYNLAVALQRAERYPEAIVQYQEAILLKPNFSEAFYNLGIVLEQSQQRDQALTYLRKARDLFSQQGNLAKISEVDQYVQQLTTPVTLSPVVQPTRPPAAQPQQPSFLRQTPSNRRGF
jgi:tetratricopeptide (TPR) repeat protein